MAIQLQLNPDLLQLVMSEALTLERAWLMQDQFLLTPDDSIRALPLHLWPTAQMLWLQDQELPMQ